MTGQLLRSMGGRTRLQDGRAGLASLCGGAIYK